MANDTGRDKFLDPEKWTAALTAAAGAVTAVLGMLGAGGTGTLVSRMVRNEPRTSSVGFGIIELSILLAVVSLSLYAANKVVAGRWMLRGSAFLLAFGLFVLTIPALRSYSTHEVPRVTTKLTIDKIPKLEATIKATSVAAENRVAVRIDALRSENNRWNVVLPNLYSTAIGPDALGEVDISLEIPLPRDDYSYIGINATVQFAGQSLAACDGGNSSCTFLSVKNLPSGR